MRRGDSGHSQWAVCSVQCGRRLCGLLDDLRAVAPGLGLAFGQRQPGRLGAQLRRVTGREALGHLLNSRGRRRGVGDLNYTAKKRKHGPKLQPIDPFHRSLVAG